MKKLIFFLSVFISSATTPVFSGIESLVSKSSDSDPITNKVIRPDLSDKNLTYGIGFNVATITYAPQNNDVNQKLIANTSVISAGIQPSITWHPGTYNIGIGTFLLLGGNFSDVSNFRVNLGFHVSFFKDFLLVGAGIDLVKVSGGRTTGLFGLIPGYNDYQRGSDGSPVLKENICIIIGTSYTFGSSKF